MVSSFEFYPTDAATKIGRRAVRVCNLHDGDAAGSNFFLECGGNIEACVENESVSL